MGGRERALLDAVGDQERAVHAEGPRAHEAEEGEGDGGGGAGLGLLGCAGAGGWGWGGHVVEVLPGERDADAAAGEPRVDVDGERAEQVDVARLHGVHLLEGAGHGLEDGPERVADRLGAVAEEAQARHAAQRLLDGEGRGDGVDGRGRPARERQGELAELLAELRPLELDARHTRRAVHHVACRLHPTVADGMDVHCYKVCF